MIMNCAGLRRRWKLICAATLTLASAFILFSELDRQGDSVRFHSKSGVLAVSRKGDTLTLDFPSRPPKPATIPDALIRGLGKKPVQVLKARDYFALYETTEDVRSLNPDIALLGTLDEKVIVTAAGNDCDFVSRFFAPNGGRAGRSGHRFRRIAR